MIEPLIQTLADAGSAGISLALIIFIWRKAKMDNETLNNHLEHDVKSREKDSRSRVVLAKAVTKLSETVKRCPYNK